MSGFWLDGVTYTKNINGKLHLVRIRTKSPNKNANKDRARSTLRAASHSKSRSSSLGQRASVEDADDESESKSSLKFAENFEKLADFFNGTSTLKTTQQEKEDMANDDKKEAAADDKSTSTENVTGNTLPAGFQAQPGIYQYGGRTLALVPKPQMSNTGFVGPGGYAPVGYGGQFMYGGGPGPMMGGMMMQPQMGMGMGNAGFGGFNSQYDRPQPVEVTQVNPATSITITRHVCANCGTLRSRKFQAENPLEPGEVPPISYCRKCEKEIRSTDDESEDSIELSKGKKLRKTFRQMMPEPYLIVEPVTVKEKHKKHKKEKKEEKQEAKPAVAPGDKAFLHTCAQCGRARSKKYQARHPIRKGETPAPGFCGKCQKEETSSEDSDKSDEEKKSNVSQERRSSRQFVGVSMVDGRYDERVVTRVTKQLHAPAPIKVFEDYSSSSDSAAEMPPPPRRRRSPHKTDKKAASSSNKVTTIKPIGKYLSDLIFGQKKYESTGEDLMVEHHPREHREHAENRGRERRRAESQSHHHRQRHSIYEMPSPSPLIQETLVRETIPVRRRARSLDRGVRRETSRARSTSRRPSNPTSPRKHRYNDRGDYESFDSDADTEEIAREMYKAYMSDGAPMHEEHRHYQNRENVSHASGGLAHSESFDSNKFSEASANRRRERSVSGRGMPYPGPQGAHEPQPDPVLQRPPDEVIVTTERYVFKKPELPSSARAASSHAEPVPRDDRRERASDTSSRRSQKYITHEDKTNYYPDEWTNRYGRERRESVSRPKVAVREEVHREHRRHREHDREVDDSSITAVPGSFIDAESLRSQDSRYDERADNPARMVRHKANTNTESISTDRTSDTYTTSSASYSSRNTSATERARGVAMRAYNNTQLPGQYTSESEVTNSSVRPRRERSQDRDRDRDRRRSPESQRRRRSRSRSNYHQPFVSDASEDDTNSDHATAGVSRSRSNSRDRGRKYRKHDSSDPSELTANDRIRSVSRKRRSRKVSFGGKPDQLHTYSQVSLETGLDSTATTDDVLRDIARARDLERQREEERRRDDERRERRRRERVDERDEAKRGSERERQRQRDLDYGYASGRG